MELSGQQRKKLANALIKAFPIPASLEQMLLYELDKNLRAIAGEGSLQDIVFKLIQTAESQGWLIELVSAARKQNPGNSELAAIASELLSSETSSAPQPLLSNSVTVVKPKREQEVEGSSGITSEFDVFIAHNTADKPQVRAIAFKLKQRGLKPWLDEEQIPPGRPFQDEIQQAIPLVKSAAIFLGQQGLGRWQSWELRSLISQCVERQIPVIPVLLPGVNELPEKLLFLQQFRWVAFSNNLDDEQALYFLQWGITGERSTQLLNSTEQPGQVPTLESLDKSPCVDKLNSLSKAELRRLMVKRLNRTEVAAIWFDTLDNQMDNSMSGRSLEDCVIELLQRAGQRNLTKGLLENLCTERPDIANP